MFNEHKITCENNKSVMYLFTQPFDASISLVKEIFQHLHEDVLLDWTDDYLDKTGILFTGDLIKIVAGQTIVKDLAFPKYMKHYAPPPESKVINIIQFKQKQTKA